MFSNKKATFTLQFFLMEKQFITQFKSIESYSHLEEIEKTLFDKALQMREVAYAPYSDFTVGCAILLENGEIITGSNQENAAYPSGLCAERTTIFYTGANYPGVKIKKLFVIGAPRKATSSTAIPPCGACRQSILEYEAKQDAAIEIYFASVGGEILKTKSIRDLLPFSFDSSFL